MVGLGPKRGYLDAKLAEDRADGAELFANGEDAGRAGAAQKDLGLLGTRIGGEVEVAGRPTHDAVADGSTNEIELPSRLPEELCQTAGRVLHETKVSARTAARAEADATHERGFAAILHARSVAP